MRDARDDRGPDDSLPEDDQAAVDQAFAELIAQFDDPAPGTAPSAVDQETHDDPPETGRTDRGEVGQVGDSAAIEPSRPAEPLPPFHFRIDDVDLSAGDDDEPEDEVPESEQFIPPTPPWPHPSPPVLIGWLAIAYAIVATLLMAFGVPLPRWAGWLAVAGFVGGLGLLMSRLPRHRPPDDDDGARI